MLEVEPSRQRGVTATGSDHNGNEAVAGVASVGEGLSFRRAIACFGREPSLVDNYERLACLRGRTHTHRARMTSLQSC